MGRHDADPRDRLRYLLPVVIGLVVIVLLLVGVTALLFLGGR
ncbi:MAG TPA: hypothetical protein VH637_17510 [Streptosporangiaceae bacterium]|jgi:hypothetical protein